MLPVITIDVGMWGSGGMVGAFYIQQQHVVVIGHGKTSNQVILCWGLAFRLKVKEPDWSSMVSGRMPGGA